jgi:hypothetical protein
MLLRPKHRSKDRKRRHGARSKAGHPGTSGKLTCSGAYVSRCIWRTYPSEHQCARSVPALAAQRCARKRVGVPWLVRWSRSLVQGGRPAGESGPWRFGHGLRLPLMLAVATGRCNRLSEGDVDDLRLANPDVGGEASQHDVVTAAPGRVSWLLSS